MTIDAAGNLYGTTNAGGANRGGTVFRLDKGATATGYQSAPTKLASFSNNTADKGPRGTAFGALTVNAAGDVFHA